jgi:DNA-binding response OmpR family regulator
MEHKTILIVDDDSHVKKILGLTIGRAGYKIETAANGLDALAMIREHPPDVLITDIEMPKMSGKELCLTIERELPDRKFLIIVMTSVSERDASSWIKEMTRTEYLEKPLSPKRIVARLGEYFQVSS